MKKLLFQAVSFVGLSGIGWLLDFVVYAVLGLFSQSLVLNNIISSFVGVTFVFISSTRTIFKNESRIPLKAKYVIYVAYQCVLIFVISKLLSRIDTWLVSNISVELVNKFSYIVAKIAVTPITMFLNFIVMKNIIEKI